MFPRPRRLRRTPRRDSHETRILDAREIDIDGEIEHIMRCARAGETHVVTLAPLVLCSAPGSAWVLDADDSLAYCLMNDYVPRRSPLHFETRERYAIAWEATFEVREGCFWTLEDRKATAHHALPAAEIAHAVADARRR